MTTTTAKKANRGHLLRAAKKGQLWVKCKFHYTDDYAYDNAVGFGKDDEFKRVFIRAESPEGWVIRDQINDHYANGGKWNKEIEALQNVLRETEYAHRRNEENENPGCIFMTETDFRYKSGRCWGTVENGSFSIHSNLNYEYEIRN